MIKSQKATIEKQLRQMVDMLVLNGTLTESPGLIHGKMGITTFFFHYAQHTNNMLFADYAMDIISEMLNQLNVNSPADYEHGIAGIGVGMDYLIRNHFLDVEDDICEDFDSRMMRAVLYDPWPDFSMYDGLTGYGRYWMTRLRYKAPSEYAQKCLFHIKGQIEEQLPNISQTEQTDVFCFLHDLRRVSGFDTCIGLLEQCRRKWNIHSSDTDNHFSRLGDSVTGNMVRIYQHKQYFDNSSPNKIDMNLEHIPALDMEKELTNMGLLSGYAGEGLLRMTALGQTNDNSWMFLL